MTHAFYCGDAPSRDDIAAALKASDIASQYVGDIATSAGRDAIADLMAFIVARNGVIALYQGPAETGPRALGHRSILANPCDPTVTPTPDFRDAVDGAFKVPTLRNIGLTGPYFHNGSRSTLEQVVEFYNRGGDRRGPDGNDTTGFGINPSNLDPDISPKGMTPAELTDLVAFLRNGLTDPRVAWERAPFDHPSISIMSGHVGNELAVVGTVSPNPLIAKRALNVRYPVRAVGQGVSPD